MNVEKILNTITGIVLSSAINAPKKKVFVLLVGFSLSGKSFFIGHHPSLRSFFRINSKQLHSALNSRIEELRDDNTIHGNAYEDRQKMTKELRKAILEQALTKGIAIVSESCNLERTWRAQLFSLAKQYGYKTVLIHVQCDEKTLLQRLQKADTENISRSEKPTWVALYEEVQKKRFAQPSADEADVFVEFHSENDDPEQVKITT